MRRYSSQTCHSDILRYLGLAQQVRLERSRPLFLQGRFKTESRSLVLGLGTKRYCMFSCIRPREQLSSSMPQPQTPTMTSHYDRLAGAHYLLKDRVSQRDASFTVSVGPDLPSEEALNAAYRSDFTAVCGANIAHVVNTVRSVLRLPKNTAPTTLRVLNHGAFNKIFLIQFGPTSLVARIPFRDNSAARDPVRLVSQVATYQFLSIYRSKLRTPKILYAELSTNSANVPFTLYELCSGTSLTWQEWSRILTPAQKVAIVDLLAENWVHITEPAPFKTIGHIVADTSDQPSTSTWSTPPHCSPKFRIISMLPQPSAGHDAPFGSLTLSPGHDTIVEYWHQHIELTRRTLLELKVPDDLPDKESVDELMRCVEIMHELADLAASLDPLATSSTGPPAPPLTLIHPDYAATRNILFSSDRAHIEGIVDWDDAVVIPRDIAAMYPDELMTRAWWQVDPDFDDVLEIPPEIAQEQMTLAQIAVEETQLRRRFRENVQRLAPQFAMFYTDPRARFRRRVHCLASGGWEMWQSYLEYILDLARHDAHMLVHERRLLTIEEIRLM